MPAANATTPSNDKIQAELCLEEQVDSERSHTHRRLSHTSTDSTDSGISHRQTKDREKRSSTNHPQLGTKEQAKPHKRCTAALPTLILQNKNKT